MAASEAGTDVLIIDKAHLHRSGACRQECARGAVSFTFSPAMLGI